MSAQKFVAALDVGTTTIRCYIYDKNVQIRGTASEKVNLSKIIGETNWNSYENIYKRLFLVFLG